MQPQESTADNAPADFRPNAAGADTLRAALAAQSIRVHLLEPGAPSMEDVFMTLSKDVEPAA